MIKNDHKLLNCIEINPISPPKKSIIWLHGLGASGDDFVPIVPELNLPAKNAARFVFPHAPVMPVTINQGYEMPAWFDIYGFSPQDTIDEKGITQSILHVKNLIAKEEAQGVSAENIILAGFSQGAVIALTAGIMHQQRLGGIIALSGYLPAGETWFQQASNANKHIPIFLAHGTQDNIVPFMLGEITHRLLTQAGYSVEWHSYPMPHSVCQEEIRDISHWIQSH